MACRQRGVGVIGHPRHVRLAEKMHRKNCQIDADEGQPEMQLAQEFRIHLAGDFSESSSTSQQRLRIPTLSGEAAGFHGEGRTEEFGELFGRLEIVRIDDFFYLRTARAAVGPSLKSRADCFDRVAA